MQSNVALTVTLPVSEVKITFDYLQNIFHQSRSDFPCEYWKPSIEGFNAPIKDSLAAPSEHKLQTPLIELHELGATVHYDILGLTYWMLTRVEEIGRTDLDNHQRFPATSCHAFKHGYLERPIVDEWLHILGQIIQRVWPGIELKQHQFTMKVSHDVDAPAHYAFQNLKGLVRTMGGDVLVRKDVVAALKAPWIWLNSKQTIHPKDPANTFDWLMRQSEESGLTSAFYFICGRTDVSKDAKYDPEMPQIRKLMYDIHQRGHEIGLHPSYNTYNRPGEIVKEANRLRKICREEGIKQSDWGGRMHFLRWNQTITQKALALAGMSYDSTLGYADRPGFRCGTCFEYPAFDVATDKPLSLRVRPLVAMDCTIIAERYLGLGSTEAAYEKFNELKENCRKVGGGFTLLWHNSFFNSPKDFFIYRRLVSER
ncbi:polysaccharide deacetylase family protein [Marinobacterium sp. xm-a-152]|uniref:polysaccharide deacetylase family protein n=1 Tax=Marinobacterium sp. xm-a-152 TaxID=2497733 RepID=UPI001C2BB10E|nr:polysaccharide deacetylase family protein [Marinobacterium sp. xm-a-152]